jgi:hypothetical protein
VKTVVLAVLITAALLGAVVLRNRGFGDSPIEGGDSE